MPPSSSLLSLLMTSGIPISWHCTCLLSRSSEHDCGPDHPGPGGPADVARGQAEAVDVQVPGLVGQQPREGHGPGHGPAGHAAAGAQEAHSGKGEETCLIICQQNRFCHFLCYIKQAWFAIQQKSPEKKIFEGLTPANPVKKFEHVKTLLCPSPRCLCCRRCSPSGSPRTTAPGSSTWRTWPRPRASSGSSTSSTTRPSGPRWSRRCTGID